MNTPKKLLKKIRDNYKNAICILLILFTYGIFFFIGFGCPIKFMTGISCAGCGMTRAWLQLLTFHFKRALYYHPLVLAPPVWLFFFFSIKKRHPKCFRIISICFIILFLLVWGIRLLFYKQTIVVFDPQNGFYIKKLKQLWEVLQYILIKERRYA